MNILKKLKSMIVPVMGLFAALFATSSMAVDYTTLTTAVDYADASAAILVVGAALAGFYIAWRGVTYILSAIKRG